MALLFVWCSCVGVDCWPQLVCKDHLFACLSPWYCPGWLCLCVPALLSHLTPSRRCMFDSRHKFWRSSLNLLQARKIWVKLNWLAPNNCSCRSHFRLAMRAVQILAGLRLGGLEIFREPGLEWVCWGFLQEPQVLKGFPWTRFWESESLPGPKVLGGSECICAGRFHCSGRMGCFWKCLCWMFCAGFWGYWKVLLYFEMQRCYEEHMLYVIS